MQNLSVDAPAQGGPGGLNSTLTISGGIPPGASVNIAITLEVLSTGTFWIGYDVDATIAA